MRNVSTPKRKSQLRALEAGDREQELSGKPEPRKALPVDLNLRRQFEAVRRLALFVYLPAVILLSVALVQQKVPVPDLFRDLTTVEDEPFYAGVYSQLGAVFWACAMAVCFFGWMVLRKTSEERKWGRFFLAAAAFTALLLFDDLFLLHDEILPRFYAHAQIAMFVLYALGAFAFLILFRTQLLSTNYGVLLVALTFLGLSVAIDVWSSHWIGDETPDFTRIRIFFEDGTKFLGILGWLTYFAGVASGRIGSLISPPGERDV